MAPASPSSREASGPGRCDIEVVQVAISSFDLETWRAWYIGVLGFVPSGFLNPRAFLAESAAIGDTPPDLRAVMGTPAAPADMMYWLLDQQDFFQYELFQFDLSMVSPLPEGWRPCDIGYTMIGLHVVDWDGTLARLRRHGVPTLTEPIGPPGSRRVCLRDPDGIRLELMEDDLRTPRPRPRPRPGIPVVTRSVTASVPDVARSVQFFTEVLGFQCADSGVVLHDEHHEQLWGLPGARREVALLWIGDFWLELVQYADPIGKPWPAEYRLGDQGILNIALGTRSLETYQAVCDAVARSGAQVNIPFESDFNLTTYLVDAQGFSVEIAYLTNEADALLGFIADGEATPPA